MSALFKTPVLRSKKLRDSARGEPCTVQIPDVCNHNPETTVLAHLPDDSGTGKMGGKVDDWCACFACSDCHDVLDGRNPVCSLDEWYMRRAMVRTWRRWIEMGLIQIR